MLFIYFSGLLNDARLRAWWTYIKDKHPFIWFSADFHYHNGDVLYLSTSKTLPRYSILDVIRHTYIYQHFESFWRNLYSKEHSAPFTIVASLLGQAQTWLNMSSYALNFSSVSFWISTLFILYVQLSTWFWNMRLDLIDDFKNFIFN